MRTKTKIIIASLASAALLFGAAVIGYQDFQLRGSAPGNPASGYLRIWADNTAGKFKCLTSAGAACFFDSGSTLTLKTNGTNNGSQSTLNLAAGSNVTLTDGGTGTVTITSSAGGWATNFPLTIVQEASYTNGTTNTTSYTVTFPSALASSGNTAFMMVSCDGSTAVTAPTGWTVDLNVAQPTYARFMLVHKATAGETSATFTVASASTFSLYFFEASGSHALDQSATGGVANTQYIVLPAITPTANSVVFGMAAFLWNGGTGQEGQPVTQPINPAWNALGLIDPVAGGRCIGGYASRGGASNVSTKPPVISLPTVALYASGGIAYATFSIL